MGFSEFFCNMAQNLELLLKCKGFQALAFGLGGSEGAGWGVGKNTIISIVQRAVLGL